MKRINYLTSWSERRLGVAFSTAISADTRRALAALACSVALVAVLYGVQQTRLSSARQEGDNYARQLAALQISLARAQRLQREVEELRAVDARRSTLRASGGLAADEVATLGNRLPRDTWLTTLRADVAAIELQGHGAGLPSIGSAVASLARLPSYADVRVISARDEAARAGLSYALALERKR